MPIRNIDKKKSNNEETKTEWQTTFCDLVHPPSLQKETKAKWQTSCCAVPSLHRCKKRGKTSQTNKKQKRKQRAYWQTSCCDFVQPPSLQKKKTNKKAKKTSEATKSRMANYLPWPCPASISAWQQLAPVSDQGSMPIMPMGKLETIFKKVLLFQTRSWEYGRTFLSGHVQG